ncbi:MAG: DUF421 domain-containing protein [Chloroflexota bacterium]
MDLSEVIGVSPEGLTIVVLRTLVVYLALLVGLRLAGKRELGQMTPFDLVVVLVISNAVQNAMVGPDTSLAAGLAAAFTLLLANWTLNRAGLKWSWLQRGVVGSPTLLISHGRFIGDHLRREGIEPDEVLMAMREHGIADVSDVETAVLEVDGTISIIPMGTVSHRTRRRLRGRKPVG